MSFQKEYEDFLMHYGVPGMKWGRRKAQSSGYSDAQVKRDIALYGKRGARKINSYMLKGDSYMTARHKMGHKRYKRAIAREKVGKVLGLAGAAGGIATMVGGNIEAKRIRDKIDAHNAGVNVYNLTKGSMTKDQRDLVRGAAKSNETNIKKSAKRANIGAIAGLATSLGAGIGGAALAKSGSKNKRKYEAYR